MAKARSRTPGPRNTLVEDKSLAEVKRKLADGGYKSLSQAAISVGFQPNVLIRILRDGLSKDPHHSTVERLKKLGIYDMVARRESA
jgi:hypothetical protein